MTKLKPALFAVLIVTVLIAIATAPSAAPLQQADLPTVAETPAPTPTVIDDGATLDLEEMAPRCYKCSGSSKGGCADKFCYGERSDCSKKGCKITGSTSKCTGKKAKNQC